MIQPLWRTVWRFLKKVKIEVPYDPAIPLLGIYPEKTIIQKESCTTIFTAVLLTTARTWKQPKCPLTDERIKKMWHIYTTECYAAIKRNEIELFVVRWMDLETVIKSEVSQKEKNTCISQYCEKPLYVAGRNINGAATVGNCIAFSQKLNLELLFHFCIYPKEQNKPFAATWMQLEIIILSEVSQKEKANTI